MADLIWHVASIKLAQTRTAWPVHRIMKINVLWWWGPREHSTSGRSLLSTYFVRYFIYIFLSLLVMSSNTKYCHYSSHLWRKPGRRPSATGLMEKGFKPRPSAPSAGKETKVGNDYTRVCFWMCEGWHWCDGEKSDRPGTRDLVPPLPLFIHSFNRCLLSPYCVQGKSQDETGKKTNTHASWSLYSCGTWKTTNNKFCFLTYFVRESHKTVRGDGIAGRAGAWK